MAEHANSTTAPSAHLDPATFMLARLFPRWKGDASEPGLPPPAPSNKPAPAAAARLPVEA